MFAHPNNCQCGGSHHEHTSLSTNARLLRDPTMTTTLRRKFEADINRRFRLLKKQIRQALIELDVLGLKLSTNSEGYSTNVTTLPPAKAFEFKRDGEKVADFMDWLNKAAYDGILGISYGTPVGQAGAQAWSNVYIQSAYQRGLVQAGGNLKRGGVEVSDRWIDSAFLRPVHADRAGLIYTRTFQDLTGITDETSKQISRVLAQGIVDGKGVQAIAKSISDRVDKIGRTRARTLARTEVISAHATASLNAYKEAGLEGVQVQAEWATAGDDQVCPECQALEGKVYTLQQADGLIPLHPNCRCAFIPVIDNPRNVRLD